MDRLVEFVEVRHRSFGRENFRRARLAARPDAGRIDEMIKPEGRAHCEVWIKRAVASRLSP